jgi:hypothetical protein
MAIIYQETFSDGPDKGLVLSNEEWGRALQIGSDWTRIRMGMLVAMEPDGVNNISGAQFRLGFSTAANDHLGSLSAKLWYGAVLNGGSSTINYAGGSYTYTANSNNSYFATANLPRVRALNGALSGSSNSGTYYIPTLNNNKRRAAICIGLKKSSTTLVSAPRCPPSGAGAIVDFTLADLLATMEDATDDAVVPTLACKGINLTGSSTSFSSYPDHAAAYGEIVAPHIGWNKTVAKLHVYAVVISRFE